MSSVFRPWRILVSLGVVGAVTATFAAVISLNPTTVALAYVVVILLIATAWGITEATAASLLATLCFNLFFLPPVGTLTIADPQNWVALAVFLVTATVASQLSGRARRRNIDALAREFKTPLTSMKVATSDLRSTITEGRNQERVQIVDEELDRLQERVTDAVQMLRASSFRLCGDRITATKSITYASWSTS